MEGIAKFCGLFGIENIALYIFLFTIIVNILLLPLTIKQQKYTRMNSVIQPELQAVQKKYKGKTGDQQAMQQQQAEINAIYKKYGTSPTSGCLPLLVQMPILFALYRVIYNIPAYVSDIYKIFQNVADPIMGQAGYADTINKFITDNKIATTLTTEGGTEVVRNSVVDFLYKLSSTQWTDLKGVFPALTDQIQTAAEHVSRINSFFFGINLMDAPGFRLSPALLIPVLAGVTQWISMKILQAGQPQPTGNDSAAGTMKMMNNLMPLISVFFTLTLPACIGIYWVASSVVRTVIQVIINQFLKKTDIDAMIAKNVAKQEKKLERRGKLQAQIGERANTSTKSTLYSKSNINTSSINANYSSTVNSSSSDYKNTVDIENKGFGGLFGKKNTGSTSSKSIAEKARMVNSYNEKNRK